MSKEIGQVVIHGAPETMSLRLAMDEIPKEG